MIAFFWAAFSGANGSFLSVDRRALSAPRSVESSIPSLVDYLCPGHYSDTQKARAIFRWIADRIRYDIEGLRSNKLIRQTPAEVLRLRKAVCAGYSRLFEAMAKEAGLEAVYVRGRSPFNDNLPLGSKEIFHAWNAVFLSGRWCLLDVTWASGHVTDDGAFEAKFEDYWYDTPPDQFIYSHFPLEDRWQFAFPNLERRPF